MFADPQWYPELTTCSPWDWKLGFRGEGLITNPFVPFRLSRPIMPPRGERDGDGWMTLALFPPRFHPSSRNTDSLCGCLCKPMDDLRCRERLLPTMYLHKVGMAAKACRLRGYVGSWNTTPRVTTITGLPPQTLCRSCLHATCNWGTLHSSGSVVIVVCTGQPLHSD